jgi:hypothetical protein
MQPLIGLNQWATMLLFLLSETFPKAKKSHSGISNRDTHNHIVMEFRVIVTIVSPPPNNSNNIAKGLLFIETQQQTHSLKN